MNLKNFIFVAVAVIFAASCTSYEVTVAGVDGSNDLVRQLESEGFDVRIFPTVRQAMDGAEENSGVLVLSGKYPEGGGLGLSEEDLALASRKNLRVFAEFPEKLGSVASAGMDTLDLERIVVCDSISPELPAMSLLAFNKCILQSYDSDSPVIVAAKVAGFDTAVYGLKDTPVKPVLFHFNDNVLVSSTCLSGYARSRYLPEYRMKSLFEYIAGWLCGENIRFDSWNTFVRPAYGENEPLAKDARKESIAKGIEWYFNGHFIVDKSWKESWADKYIGDGTMPVGPEVPSGFPDGDGSLGVLEGHMSTINYDGSQMYRYWMRADVQGESAYAFASAADLLGNEKYAGIARNLLEYSFDEYRDGERNDPDSPSYGLLGWARTHKGTYYGDDNARYILGALGAVKYLDTKEFDKKIIEAVIGNFRTSGSKGFRGCTLYEPELQSKGWKYFYERELVNPHPHFEAWLWACYLWLYDRTGWKPLFDRVGKGVAETMAAYPQGWSWTNGIQQERARMILPLAWLYRVDPSEQHLEWLDYMVGELLKNQVRCGGIREELGDPSKSSFGRTPSNEEYGVTEAPLIFDNGDPVADMLYTTNFAFVGLCEAAAATGNPEYVEAVRKMSDFLIRIQVESDEFKSVDGAWFRAFDYEDWNYWASNADAGWGAWSTLTGWIQSWIVGTQVLLEKDTSLWELLNDMDISETASGVIGEMITDNR